MIQLLDTAQATVYSQDDPVRPHLSAEFRTTSGREMWALVQDTTVDACICVAYTNAVPTNEQELDYYSQAAAQDRGTSSVAVFYTVWSYSKGSGQVIVNSVAEHILNTRPEVERWVTLSPLTRMAERFHTKNGARLVDRYSDCQTFEYTHIMLKDIE